MSGWKQLIISPGKGFLARLSSGVRGNAFETHAAGVVTYEQFRTNGEYLRATRKVPLFSPAIFARWSTHSTQDGTAQYRFRRPNTGKALKVTGKPRISPARIARISSTTCHCHADRYPLPPEPRAV